MHPLLRNQLDPIAKLCQRFSVRRLDAFGSVLRADFDATRSDVDLIAEFDAASLQTGLRGYFEFKQELERLLQRPVDLIEISGLPEGRLKRQIQHERQALYAAPA